jgi:hypothetical protein
MAAVIIAPSIAPTRLAMSFTTRFLKPALRVSWRADGLFWVGVAASAVALVLANL